MSICSVEFVTMSRTGKGCPCGCGNVLYKDLSVARIITPYQPKGTNVCMECFKNRVGLSEEYQKKAVSDSKNCADHIVRIENVTDEDVIYFTKYGFNIVDEYAFQTYHNAQSAGVVVDKAINDGYKVEVRLASKKSYKVMKSIEDYDRFTKEICMRGL